MATTKPVRILVVGMDMTPELLALRDEGHTVRNEHEFANYDIISFVEYDLILGPKCWRIGPEHMKNLALAIKEARAAMPKRKKKE